MNRNTSSSNTLPGEIDELFHRANPVALEDVPDSRSPFGEALYERVLEALGREPDPAIGLRRRRTWLTRRLVAVTAAATVGAIAIAFLPGRLADEGRVNVLQRALAAVSAGAVTHTVVENSDLSTTLVDLESGAESVESLRDELWYDEERDELCVRRTLGDEILRGVHCSSIQASGPPISHPALSFASRYRAALESGTARVIRRETVDGREAAVLAINVPPWKDKGGRVVQPAFVEEVAVDEQTFKPLRFRHLPGPVEGKTGEPGSDVVAAPVSWWRVISIESIDRDPQDFVPARGPALRYFGPTSNDREVTRAEAAAALGRTALWPGAEVGGAKLERIGVESVAMMRRVVGQPAPSTIISPADAAATSPALVIRYGSKEDHLWIWLGVGISPEGTPRFGPADGVAVPAGKLRLAFVKALDGRSIDMWFGNVQRDGLYITMQSPQRELVIAAARALKPLE